MAISNWSPANELTNLHSTMDRLFGNLFAEVFESPSAGEGRRTGVPSYRLPVDIVETENGYRIQAPVPGFRPEDVEVTFSDGVLTIRGSRSREQSRQEGNYLRREVAFGDYVRQIALPGRVQAENIKATFDNGLLTVDVPRESKPEPRRIEIQQGQQSEQLPSGVSR